MRNKKVIHDHNLSYSSRSIDHWSWILRMIRLALIHENNPSDEINRRIEIHKIKKRLLKYRIVKVK